MSLTLRTGLCYLSQLLDRPWIVVFVVLYIMEPEQDKEEIRVICRSNHLRCMRYNDLTDSKKEKSRKLCKEQNNIHSLLVEISCQ